VTNASRTLLFDIAKQRWCPDLLALFRMPAAVLPQVCDSADDFGVTHLLGGEIPIRGIAGDQQAALVGQSCLRRGRPRSPMAPAASC
jgi:glycerol kinase